MKVDYKEIFKLKVMLDMAGIDYEFLDRSYKMNIKSTFWDGEWIHFQIVIYKDKKKEKRLISVIQGNGTIGESEDRLEIMGCLTKEEEKFDSVLGYLTAEEVFKRIISNMKGCK